MGLLDNKFDENEIHKIAVFSESLSFDSKLYWHHIVASTAHAVMLGEAGIITKEEAEAIKSALADISADVERGAIDLSGASSIYEFVNGELANRLGATGKLLNLGISENDQSATDLRLYLKDSILNITYSLRDLISTLIIMADANVQYIMPGYTHMRKAEPVSLAQYINSFSEMFLRDMTKFVECYKRTDVMPLGSGDVSGVAYPINRKLTSNILKFGSISQNAIDAVSDRDFAADFVYCCSSVMSHMSRICADLLRFGESECGFIELKDYDKASDNLPHKSNPVVIELIKGKTGAVYGDLVNVLTTLKGMPLSYNQDLVQILKPVFDAEEQVSACVKMFNDMLQYISFDTRGMRNAAMRNCGTSAEIVRYLFKKGMPYDEAYELTGKIIDYCTVNEKAFDRLPLAVYKEFSPLFERDIRSAVTVASSVASKHLTGGSARTSVRENIRSITKRLNKVFR